MIARTMLPLLLLPLLAIGLPLLYLVAWVCEALADVARERAPVPIERAGERDVRDRSRSRV